MDTAAFETHITEVIRRTRDVLSFRAAVTEGMNYRAGQFLGVTVRSGGQELSKYLSFSSAPTEKRHIEFTKKISGSDFSKALECLKPGDKITLRMPLGSFLLEEKAPKHLFLSGGIGITPIRSMWRDAFDRRLPLDMALLYGNRTPEDIAFKEDLEGMMRDAKDFKVVFSLDTEAACPSTWKGRCGFINAPMIKEEVPDYLERIFYVCGPPVMVKLLLTLLQEQLKVPENRIKRENFAGY